MLLISQENSNILYPYKISESPVKLNRIAVFGNTISPDEIVLGTMYDHLYLVHNCAMKQEVIMYKLKSDGFFKERTMNLFSLGALQCSIIDSLFVVHNTMNKMSMIYDVALPYENPLTYPQPIAPYKPYSVQSEMKSSEPTSVTLYSDKWRYLMPNIIMDLECGFVFELNVFLTDFPLRLKMHSQEESDIELIRFFSRRIGGKWKLIETIRNYCCVKPLTTCMSMFKFICRVYLEWIRSRTSSKSEVYDDEGEWSMVGKDRVKPDNFKSNVILNYVQNPVVEDEMKQSPVIMGVDQQESELNLSQSQYGYTVLDQQDMWKNVFCELESSNGCSLTNLFTLLLEYMRALRALKIRVSDYIQRLAIEVLIKDGRFNMLHQYIQYKIIMDSRNIALQILSIEDKYKPAFQIAMDMLIRCGDHSVICEVLIARKKIGHALSVMHNNSIKSIPFNVIFEGIIQQNDDLLFYNAFEIIRKIQGNNEFTKRPDMEEYIKLYKEKFGSEPK